MRWRLVNIEVKGGVKIIVRQYLLLLAVCPAIIRVQGNIFFPDTEFRNVIEHIGAARIRFIERTGSNSAGIVMCGIAILGQ